MLNYAKKTKGARMDWSKIGSKVSTMAPLLGAAIGGPGGGAIGALVASALGSDNKEPAILSALSSPDAAIRLREIESEHKVKLEQIAIDKLSVELSDKANAREHHKHSIMPAVITIMLTLMVAGLLYSIFQRIIPADQLDLAMMMFGQVFALWGASVTYWVGTTRSSAEKDRRGIINATR